MRIMLSLMDEFQPPPGEEELPAPGGGAAQGGGGRPGGRLIHVCMCPHVQEALALGSVASSMCACAPMFRRLKVWGLWPHQILPATTCMSHHLIVLLPACLIISSCFCLHVDDLSTTSCLLLPACG